MMNNNNTQFDLHCKAIKATKTFKSDTQNGMVFLTQIQVYRVSDKKLNKVTALFDTKIRLNC